MNDFLSLLVLGIVGCSEMTPTAITPTKTKPEVSGIYSGIIKQSFTQGGITSEVVTPIQVNINKNGDKFKFTLAYQGEDQSPDPYFNLDCEPLDSKNMLTCIRNESVDFGYGHSSVTNVILTGEISETTFIGKIKDTTTTTYEDTTGVSPTTTEIIEGELKIELTRQ